MPPTNFVPKEPVMPTPRPASPQWWAYVLVVLLVIVIGVGGFFLFAHRAPSTTTEHVGVENLGTPGTTRIIGVKYPSDDTIVSHYVIGDPGYEADKTGQADATKTFQKALDDAAAEGGGTVFAPEGVYRFDGTLVIPNGVTLEGDWKQPTDSDKAVGGTVFAVYDDAQKGKPDGDSFIGLSTGTGIKYVTIYYPEESLDKVVPYPAAVGAYKGPNNITVDHVTLVNPYIGIDFGNDSKSLGHGSVRDVYGTPLSLGLYEKGFGSIPYATTVHFDPAYWAGSGLSGAPSDDAISSYLQNPSHSAVAFHFAGAGGSGYNTDLSARNYETGVIYDDQVHGGTDPHFFGLAVTGAHTGFLIDLPMDKRVYLTQSSITADQGSDAAAVRISAQSAAGDFNQAMLLVNESTLNSTGTDIDNESTQGYGIQAVHSTFAAWNGYAITAKSGIVEVEGSTLARGSNASDFNFGPNVRQVVLLANSLPGGSAKVAGSLDASVIWENESSLSLPSVGIASFASIGFDGPGLMKMIPDEPLPAHTGPGTLYLVTDYGATTSAKDNTAAFQKALDAAGAAGGGTVYVPPGSYAVPGQITVPSGVLLLGANTDTKFNGNSGDTNIAVTGGSVPSIILKAHAGIEGMLVWLTNQGEWVPAPGLSCGTHTNEKWAPKPFNYTIQGQGQGVWVDNMVVANATNGIDFGTYDTTGHYLSDVDGMGFQNLVYVSKSKSGFMAYMGEAPASWLATSKSQGLALTDANPPPKNCLGTSGDAVNVDSGGAAVTLGSAENELLFDTFAHSPYTGIKTVADGGTGPSFTSVNFGAETYNGFDIEALGAGGAKIINSDYHTIAPNGVPYVIVGSGVPASSPLTFFSLRNFSRTPVGMTIAGGNVRIQGYITNLYAVAGEPTHSFANISGNAVFTMLSGVLGVNDFDSGIVNTTGTAKGALAGVSIPPPLSFTGSVDDSLMPDAAAPSDTGSTGGKGGGGKKKKSK